MKDLPEPPPSRAFDGETYEPPRDYPRLKGRIGDVFILMSDAKWRTLYDITNSVGGSEAGNSAMLRHLRKKKYGSHTVERKYIQHGQFCYKLVVNNGDD